MLLTFPPRTQYISLIAGLGVMGIYERGVIRVVYVASGCYMGGRGLNGGLCWFRVVRG